MLQTYLQDFKLAPRERVRKLASSPPSTLRKKQKVWWVSVSILSWKKDTEGLSNRKAKEKKDRLFKEIWDANSHLWKPHGIEASFSVHDCGECTELIQGFMKMLDAHGLTPETFDDFLISKTTMNDAKR